MSQNGVAVNGNGHSNGQARTGALDIAIVGAGIGGLMAAIGLAKNGHNVNLYEQSQFANETGAAIHLAPNANGLLRRYGLIPETFGAVEMLQLAEYNEKGETQRLADLREPSKMWQHPWQLVHRVRLHNNLKKTAQEAGAILNLSSRVAEVDPEKGTLTFESGKIINADVIVGADGIYSKTRASIGGKPAKLFTSGKAAFRFLIPRKVVEADPETAKLVERNNELVIWYSQDRRLVMYPCDNNELLNFVCIHPEGESAGSEEEWNKQASLEQLLAVYKTFPPALLKLLSKAEPSTVKVWKLLDMEILPTWTKGKLTLLGDAAHPFLPHQGQGGGIAMEDAVALAVVLPGGTPAAEVPERLKLYEKIRYERANAIQEYSRLAGKDFVGGKPQIDMMKYTVYNFCHDEYDNSTKIFREWTWAKHPGLYKRMPVAFGPMPGPRQDHYGALQRTGKETFRTASMKFKTSRTFLQNLFPNESFSFISPGSVAHASFSVTTLDKMRWLGGGGYSHFGLYIHGVQYTKKDGSKICGTYMPLLFESLTDPIVSGREELGMPKLYCQVDIYPRANSYRMKASWQGAQFAELAINNLEEMDPKTDAGIIGGENDDGILVHRYIPKVGIRGEADAEYSVVVPHSEESGKVPSTVHTLRKTTNATIDIDPMDWEALPTLHHVVSTLAEIPIYEVVGAKVVEGTGVPDVSSARRIE